MDFHNINDADINDVLAELYNPADYMGFLRTMSRFSSYSWRNVFLIYKQMPHASKLAEFEVWKEQYGRTIKLGSTGIKINVPIEQKPKKKVKQVSMMDISQTQGNPVLILAGDVMSGESLRGVFTDVLRAMPPFNAQQEIDSDIQADMYGTVKQIVHERLENTAPDKNDFIIESIAYVVCQRFAVETDVEFIGFEPENIAFLDADILDTISKHSKDIITTIEDRFAVICKERGLDPMTLPRVFEATPETEINAQPQAEPQYSKEVHTEIIAGVEFSQYAVKPLSASDEKVVDITATQNSAPQTATEIMPTIPENLKSTQIKSILKYLPDITINITERNQYGYTRPELLPLTKERAVDLFRRDMTIYLLYKDNTESMAHYLSDIVNHDGIFGIAYGAWQNSREYIALASGNPEARREARFVYDGGDSFAVYQTAEPGDSPTVRKSYEELQEKGLTIDRYNYNLVYTASLPDPPSDTPEGIFMWLNAEQLKDYGGRVLTVSDVLSIKKDEIITSYYANGRTFKELLSFIGEEGRRNRRGNEIAVIEQNTSQEKQEPEISISISNSHEKDIIAVSPAKQFTLPIITKTTPSTAQTAAAMQPSSTKTPPALPVIKSDLSLYRASAKEAEEDGTTALYELNQRMNNHCAKSIENAIQVHKKDDSCYDLKTPAKRLIKIYGRERMMWVLSKHILAVSNKFSEINRKWAESFINDGTGSGDEIPSFSINTRHAVLEAFINEFRTTLNKKSSFNEKMKDAKRKSEAHNSNA
jgi:hypothetical protein